MLTNMLFLFSIIFVYSICCKETSNFEVTGPPGATASTRGASGHSAFSSAKMAKRALAQSLARELGPLGVHVAHVIVDGAVDNINTRWT